eukprot:1041735-Prorocentrum_minimum.AAC.3
MRYMQVSVPQDNDIRGKVALGPLQALASKENDLLRGTGDWHNIQGPIRFAVSLLYQAAVEQDGNQRHKTAKLDAGTRAKGEMFEKKLTEMEERCDFR